MTLTLAATTSHQTLPRPVAAPAREPTAHITLYGDLTCPWSYLASRRAALLATAGVVVDWWMVEHDRPVPGRQPDHEARVEATRRDLARVEQRLLPGEQLPAVPASFVPYTRPAVSGYAEAYLAGVGPQARRLLFAAYWLHGIDLGGARVVRSLLADTVRSGHSTSEPIRDWGYAVDVTGAPVTTAAWHLVRQWRRGWAGGGQVVPALLLDDGRRLRGVEAVEWLGSEVARYGIDPGLLGQVAPLPEKPRKDLADLSWASEHGNRWMQARRTALSGELFSRLRPWI